jgi:FkbM family methyltransferase
MSVIVQIGACIGQDHVSQFYADGNELHIVEANKMHLPTLNEQYPNASILNAAIVVSANHGRKMAMYYSTNDAPKYEVTSMMVSHVTKHGYAMNTIKKFYVQCVGLTEYLRKINKPIEILFLDIEGLDEDVLLDTDLSEFDIANIQVERLHLRNKDLLQEHLNKHGYYETDDSYDRFRYDRIWKRQ